MSGPQQAPARKFKGFNSRIVFVIALLTSMIPGVMIYLLQSTLSVDFFMFVLTYDRLRNFLFLLIGFEVYSCAMAGDASDSRIQLSIFWVLIFSCLWIRDYPQIPVLVALMGVPLSAILTQRSGKNPAKNWIWIGNAAVTSLILTVAGWVVDTMILNAWPARSPTLSHAADKCPSINRIDNPPSGFEYVSTAIDCRAQAVALGIVATAEEANALVPFTEIPGCCVYRNFTTGLLFSEGPCPQPEANMHYLCQQRGLPTIAGQAFNALRLELVKNVYPIAEPRCKWGYHLFIDEQSESEGAACQILEEWSALYRAAPWMLVIAYFLMACVSFLRGRYLYAVERRGESIEDVHMSAKGVLIGVFTVLFAAFLGVQMIDAFQFESIWLRYYVQMLGAIIAVCFFYVVRNFEVLHFAGTAAHEISGLTLQLAEYIPYLLSIEWVQAGMTFFLWPLYFVLAMYGYLSHAWAKRRMEADDPRQEQQFSRLFLVVHEYIRDRWHMPFVLDKCWLIAVAVVFVLATARGTPVALSWLDKNIQSWSLSSVMISFTAFGAFMFLNPFAPGMVVYFFSGLIVTKRAHDPANLDSMSYANAVLLGIAVAMGVKLIACWIQMQIGICLGRSTQVRYLVGLHTPLIRAIEVILRTKSFSVHKFGVLNGGPDWPTSVFCGILGLSPSMVMFWTLPTILIVIPAVIAGSTVSETSPAWQTVFQMTFTLAMLFQVIFGCLAARGVAAVTDKNAVEINCRRDDLQDLVDIDETEARRTRALQARAHWSDLPQYSKVCILAAGIISMLVALVLLIGSGICIREFKMGADYELPLEKGGLDGDFRNILYPTGAICLLLIPIAGVFDMFWWASVYWKVYREPAEPTGPSSIQMISYNTSTA